MRKKTVGKTWAGWLGEEWRQVIHILFGACVMLGIALAGVKATALALLVLLSVALLFITWSMLGRRNLLFDFLIEKFERRVDIPSKGALMYLIGSLFLVTFSMQVEFALASIGILAFGDGLATLFGVRGRTRLWWNEKKSLEGAVAFVVGGTLASVPLIGFSGVIYSTLLALIETLPTGLDDNLLIPVAAIVLNAVI